MMVRWGSGECQISIWAWHWWTWNLSIYKMLICADKFWKVHTFPFQRPSWSPEGMLQTSLRSYSSHGRTPRVSCLHCTLIREVATSSQATCCVEDITHLHRGAASSGVCRREAGSRCPSLSQRRDTDPVSGEWARTAWSSWEGGVMQQGRLQRQSQVTETAQGEHSTWNIRQGEIKMENH